MSEELVEQLVAENKMLREQLAEVSIPVLLSSSNVKFAERDEIVEITAVALCEGTWKGVYYPLDEIKKAYERWVEQGRPKIPILVEHGKDPHFGIKVVGEVEELRFDDDLKALFLKGKVIDPEAIERIKNGELTHISLAQFITTLTKNNQKIASDITFVEASLTQAPCCPACTILNVEELGEFELRFESDLAYPFPPRSARYPIYKYPFYPLPYYGYPYGYPQGYPTPQYGYPYGYPYRYPQYGYPYGYPLYGYPPIKPEDIQALMDRITQLEERVQAIEDKLAEMSKTKIALSETAEAPREAVTTDSTTDASKETTVSTPETTAEPQKVEVPPEKPSLEDRLSTLEERVSRILELLESKKESEVKVEVQEAKPEEKLEEPKVEETKPSESKPEESPKSESERKPEIDLEKLNPIEVVIAYGRKAFKIEE